MIKKVLLFFFLGCQVLNGYGQACDSIVIHLLPIDSIPHYHISLDTLIEYDWIWSSLRTVGGSGYDEVLSFKKEENNDLTATSIGIRVGYHYYLDAMGIEDTTLSVGHGQLCGNILNYNQHQSTVAMIGDYLVLHALIPIDSTSWYYNENGIEYLFEFDNDPFVVSTGVAIVKRHPSFEFDYMSTRQVNYSVHTDRYGLTITLVDKASQRVHYNYPTLQFSNELKDYRVSSLGVFSSIKTYYKKKGKE